MVEKDKKNEKVNKDTKRLYDNVIKAGVLTNFLSGKGSRRIATAFIYERVGNSEKFIGAFPLLKGTFNIGEYCVLQYNSKNYFIDVPNSEMFTPAKDPKLDKIVEIVKFAEDDLRVRGRINTDYYKKYKRHVIEEVPLEQDGQVVVDEENLPVMVKRKKKDEKTGEYIFETVEERYVEPKSVTQEGRDAIRVHNETCQEIKKFKEANESFWSKFSRHGGVTIIGLAIVVFGMIMMGKFMTDAWIEGVNEISGEIRDANSNLQWWQQPDALEKIGQAVDRVQDEKDSPPVK